jgi:subtilisin family serine protease
VQVWKVKIINLSIGFDRDKLDVLEKSRDYGKQILLHALWYARQQNVVVFAAASNHANRKRLAFPACKPDYVLSINSTNGSGGKSWFNPQKQEFDGNLSILGEHIKSTWLQQDINKERTTKTEDGSVWKRQEGTSQATTIAACVAVLVLQFGRQYGIGPKLETFDGVREVLRGKNGMTNELTDQSFRDIVPWTTVFRTSSNHDDNIDRIRTRIEEILDDV